MNNLQKINDKIISFFEKNEPFSIIRIGNMEGHFLDCISRQTFPIEEYFYWLSLTSGVYPITPEYLVDIWTPINTDSMLNADMLGFVDISGDVERNVFFRRDYCNDKFSFYGVKDIEILDPGILLDKNKIINPWTRQLKGKKVLVVTSHVNTIKEQWNNKENIWGKYLDDITPFELVDVIRSPFHPQMDDRQFPNCSTWDESLNYMKNIIDTYDYDVLFVGAAAYSPALANHAKMRGKIGITICGAIQLYFGIMGFRWTQDYYRDWHKLFNDFWKYPKEEDLPKNRHVFDQFEKAYW